MENTIIDYAILIFQGNDLPKDLSLLYPTLNEYMGLEFTQDVLAANMPEYLGVAYPDTVSKIHKLYCFDRLLIYYVV